MKRPPALWALGLLGPLMLPAAADAQGDAARGRAIVANRQLGLCLLCHSGPIAEEPAQGDLAPDLRGAGSRWTEAQLRQRVADPRRLNPDTIMPSYGEVAGDSLWRVAPTFRGRPLLSPGQIDDVVAYLATLRDREAETR